MDSNEQRRRLGLRPVSQRAAIMMCAAIVAAGCSSTPSTTTDSGTKVTTTGSASASPALKPIDQAALQKVVEKSAKDMLVPGAVVAIRTPQGDYSAAVGTTELGKQIPPDVNTHFRIASNSKTMTAALIVLLAQDGKLKFSDPVSVYVPDVPNGNDITVADLLKMRSGLYNYTNAPEFSARMDADPAKAWTPQDVLAIAFAHPPNAAPNTEYEYNNTNYALLGLIAEKAGGRPLAEQLRDRLFGPFGLQQTSLPAVGDTAIPSPYSHGYMYGGSAFAMVDDPYPADMKEAARAGTLKPIDYTNQNSSYAHAAGGVISTADNVTAWIRALVSGEVFNADYKQEWLDSVQAEDPDNPDGQKYGYGISYQRFSPTAAMYYHGGEMPGFNSFMGYDPDNDVSLVVWTNLTISPLDDKTTAQAMLSTLLDEIYTGLSLAPTPTPTTTR
jgi:D-alanyl-D-alanine carboxypeptidase